jgi:plasmid maintenance system antidote protein VapI
MNEKIHIGEIISQKLKEEGRTKKWLAKQVHCDQSNFCKILQKPSMDTGLLLHISLILQVNFFFYLSDYYTENQQENVP